LIQLPAAAVLPTLKFIILSKVFFVKNLCNFYCVVLFCTVAADEEALAAFYELPIAMLNINN
jgi:hypothetical protein